MTDEMSQWDAVETAERIARGEVSKPEVLEAAIARARTWEPRINAIAQEDFERALRSADASATGRFAGVPTFVKDMEDVAGLPTRFGSVAVPGRPASMTAPSVAQFLSTGVISLGKSTTAEFGLTATTEPVHGKPTRNAVDLEHSPGGSSGGAAALVASGVVPIAHGGDGGGSLRIPAAFCGLVGLKASRGRLIDMQSAKRMVIKIATYGVVTKSIRDTAAFYAALEDAGHVSVTGKLPPVGDVRGPGHRKWKVGMYLAGPFGHGISPSVDKAVHDAAHKLEAMGHTVFEVKPPHPDTLPEDFLAHWGFMAWAVEQTLRWTRGCDHRKLEPWTRGLSREFKSRWWRRFPGAVKRLRAFPGEYEACFREYDVLLSPVTSSCAPRIGELSPSLPFEEKLERVQQLFPFTPVQNASGGPAISLPAGTTDGGLPVAIQLASPLGEERRLLELAFALEETAPSGGGNSK